MNTTDLPAGITRDDIHLMRRMGVSGKYINHVLVKNGWNPTDDLPEPPRQISDPLSDPEIAILRSGGARELDDTPQDCLNLLDGLYDQLRECRTILMDSYDVVEVSSILGISTEEIEQKAFQIPPELHTFEIEAASLSFPAWQFTDSGTIPYLTELLNTVGVINTLTSNRFMLTPNTELEIEHEYLCLREWLVRGLDPDIALSAAIALRHD